MTRVTDRQATVLEAVDARRDVLLALSRRIHAQPELKFEEVKASRWVGETLAAAGFTVESPVAGLPTALRAWKAGAHWRPGGNGGTGPTVAFQAEYDALPGVGHACGHNIIAAAAVGAALAVSAVLEDLPGRVMVLGTPGEEGGGGKILLLEGGAYDGIDVVMYVHAQSKTAVMHGNMALARLGVRFRGRRANPTGGNVRLGEAHRGTNALTALLLLFNNVAALREQLEPETVLRGRITDGGEEIDLEPVALSAGAIFKVAAPSHVAAQALLARIRNCGRAAALATGAEVVFEEFPLYLERLTNPTLMALMEENLRLAGCSDPAAGAQRSPASTDSGNVSWRVPLVGAFVKVCDPSVTTHSTAFAAAAGSPTGDTAVLLGAKALALTAVDLLSQPTLLPRVRRDFEAARAAARARGDPGGS